MKPISFKGWEGTCFYHQLYKLTVDEMFAMPHEKISSRLRWYVAENTPEVDIGLVASIKDDSGYPDLSLFEMTYAGCPEGHLNHEIGGEE